MANSTEEGVRADLLRTSTLRSIDAAYADHMKNLFANFIRHSANIDSARAQFRKDLAQAQQARSEMMAIADEQ